MLWAEYWTRPGHASFGRATDHAPSPVFSFQDGLNLIGSGSMQVAESFDRFDEILKLDPANPANSVSSLCRIFSEADPLNPVFEWLPNLILPTTSKTDPNVDISGLGIKSILSHARTEAFDWDGTDDFLPNFPDWIWGGRNILRNPGFELSGVVSYVYNLWTDATGGTFKLAWDGSLPTAAIAFNASDTTVQNAIEALLNVTDVLVSGSGTLADKWRVEFVDPAFAVTTGLSCDGALLTGATLGCVLETVQIGSDEVPDGWEPSQRADRRSTPALHGNPTIFRRSSGAEPVRTGSYSLVIAGTEQYTGGQEVLSVRPGGTYQKSVWVRPNGAGQSFRLVARDRYERILTTAAGTEAFVEVTPAANTWTEMSLVDLLANLHEPSAPNNIGEPVSEIVFRFANINPTPAGIWYFDDADLSEGLAATHPGNVLTALYDDAVSNHPGRIVWEDEANPGTAYLTLDFGALDSAGAAWVDQAIEIKIWMRMSYLDAMTQLANTWGYEWRVVPNDVEAGTWFLQVYNPGTMKTDYTAAQTPAIQGGASDVRRQIRRYLPTGTDLMVEGEERITSRDRDGDLVTALGRIEGSRIDRELPSQEAVIAAAFEDKTDAVVSGLSYVYTLVDPADEPLSAYVLGDLLTIHDPPEVTDEARLVDIEVVATVEQTVYETEWIPATAVGS